ncbi:MAG: trypsin-like peptidase domain-containing protein [Isosphaeraceae bacterium]
MKRNPVAWAALIVASAALVSASGFLRPMPAAPKTPLEGQQAAKALSEAYEAVADFVRPSVVQITVQKKIAGMPNVPGMRRFQVPRGNENINPRDFEEMLKRFFGPEGTPEKEQFGGRGTGVGSGFVYDSHGHILTNNHVVENADKIEVTFYDGVTASAKVVGTDPKTDVAVIKVDNSSYQALPKGDSSKLKVGELVMAVGSPFNLSQSVTAGIISALERNDLGINGADTYESFIQTDAPINRGNSGGPLLNMNGEVIGINSAIMSGSSGNDGIGFAIPIKMAVSVADMLIKDGKVRYARIGIALGHLTPALSRQFGLDEGTKGVLVGDVVPGSPADKAGLKQGDVITSFAGEKVQDRSSFRLKVATSEVAKPYEIGFIREGSQKTAQIVPAPAEKVVFGLEEEAKGHGRTEPAAPARTTINAFGLEVQPLTPELSKPLGLPADLKGVVVSSVKEDSPAEAAGIQEGDVITKVIRDHKPQPLTSVKEFQDLSSKADELALFVQTGKVGRFVVLTKSTK